MSDTTKANHDHHDLAEAQTKVEEPYQDGSSLSRQLSVQLTNAQFERLYLEPGGAMAKGDLTKRFANPTALGIGSFLLCLSPVSCFLMGWDDTSTASLPVMSGVAFFIGGVGLYLAAIFEFILGNSFSFVVFSTFGGFWASFGYFIQPYQGIAAAAGGVNSISYNNGFAIYLAWWAAMTAIFGVASLRTNVAFVLLFFFLEIAFLLLLTIYLHIGYAQLDNIAMLIKATGVFGFLTCVCGWWIFTALVFGSTGLPVAIPLGDLSWFLAGKNKAQ